MCFLLNNVKNHETFFSSLDNKRNLKLHSHKEHLAARIGIFLFNSFSIAFVSFFIDLKKAKCRFSQLKVPVWMQLQIYYMYSKPQPKRNRLGQDPSWKCFSLLGNGATSALCQRRQASPYICYIFLFILVEKTKGFYLKFDALSLFPIFVVCFFTEICCTWGPMSKGATVEQETKKKLQNLYSFAYLRM